jgi:hypothetical protein
MDEQEKMLIGAQDLALLVDALRPMEKTMLGCLFGPYERVRDALDEHLRGRPD